MINKGKYKGLADPKITSLTREQYKKFHFVRKLTSPVNGSHHLLSYNQKKYIGK